MSVVIWFWVSAFIALFGLVVLFVQGREVWRKVVRLFEEVEAAAARAEAASRPAGAPRPTDAT